MCQMYKLIGIIILIGIVKTQNSESSEKNKCAALAPYCYCVSKLVITCDNFTDFAQLNFSKLEETKIYELELEPLVPLSLDESLVLSDLEIYGQVTLRKIKSFELTANPFESARRENLVRLNLFDLTLKFTLNGIELNNVCSMSAFDDVESQLKPLFSSFDYVVFGDNIDYNKLVCPLVFLNANIRILEMINLNSTNRFTFKKLNKIKKDDNMLNSNIGYLKIFNAKNIFLDNEFFDENVFYSLPSIEFDYCNLNGFKDDAFGDLYSLKKITLYLENMEQFLNGPSQNKWMKSLNTDISVDLTDPAQIEENLKNSFLIIFNNRIKDQDYLYADKDLDLFRNFPHEKLVFPRILTKIDLKRTKTLDFLLKNWKIAQLADRLSDLNTTSTRKVLNELIAESNPQTTPVLETTPPSQTTTPPETTQLNTLSEVQTVSIVYGIAFTLIFLDFIILKIFRLKERSKVFPAPLPPRKPSVVFELADRFKRRLSVQHS